VSWFLIQPRARDLNPLIHPMRQTISRWNADGPITSSSTTFA